MKPLHAAGLYGSLTPKSAPDCAGVAPHEERVTGAMPVQRSMPLSDPLKPPLPCLLTPSVTKHVRPGAKTRRKRKAKGSFVQFGVPSATKPKHEQCISCASPCYGAENAHLDTPCPIRDGRLTMCHPHLATSPGHTNHRFQAVSSGFKQTQINALAALMGRRTTN